MRADKTGKKSASLMRLAGVALLALTMLSPLTAKADCTTPAGVEADMYYNTTYKRVQFCDGTNWINMGVSFAGTVDNLGDHIATQVLRSDTHNTDDLGTTAIRWKDGWFAGTVTGGTFAGSGASLTSLPAANLTGTLPAISGANLTNLDAADLATGTIPAARLPAYTGDVTKAAGGTALSIAAGAVDLAHLSATGTKDSSTFLRGDNTWAPAGGGGSPSCTIRASAAGIGARTVSCGASETMTGGGCDRGGNMVSSYPSAIKTWSCTGSGSGTAYAVCCTF